MASTHQATPAERRCALDFSTPKIADFCQRWQITEMALFGSILREDFQDSSDIDILVSFGEGAAWSLLELARMELELQGFFGRKVDLVERRAVELSGNYIRRDHILRSAELVYVAG